MSAVLRVAVLLDREDDTALSVALALSRSVGAELVAIRAGGDVAAADEAALSRALLLGAGRAVRLADAILVQLDYLGLATALACTLRTLECRLIVAGDRGQGAVGPAVAERLDLPHLCGVMSARLLPAEAPENPLWVERRLTDQVQHLSGPAQAVLCVTQRSLLAAPPKTDPSSEGQGQGQAQGQGTLLTWKLDDVGLSAAVLVHRRRLRVAEGVEPVSHPRPRCFDSAAALVARLRQDGLLPRR